MGSIKIPEIERKTRDVPPELTAKAPQSLAAPFTQDVPRLAQAIKGTGQAVQGLTEEIFKRVESHQEAKRKELVNDTYFNTYGQLEQKFQEFKAKRETAGDDLVADFEAEYSKVMGQAEVNLGGDAEAIQRLRKMAENDRKRYTRELAIKVVTDREVAKATKDSNMLDKNRLSLMDNPTPTNLEAALVQMRDEIRETGYDPAKESELLKLADQQLTETYLSSIGPEQALAELDNRKLGYGAMFKDVKERENFRKTLELKAEAQKKRAEKGKQKVQDKLYADTFNALESGQAIDPFEVYNDPAVKDDPAALKEFKRLFQNYTKDTKQETKDQQLSAVINDPNLTKMTDQQIISKIDDFGDAKQAISYRDKVLKNPSVNGRAFDEVMTAFKKDYDNGSGKSKFGKGEEGRLEYMRQLRDFQTWAIANPDKDPNDYYEKIMAPINASYFSRAFAEGPFDAIFSKGVINPQASREREAWVIRAKSANPDYTEDELRTYYDQNIKGKK